MPIYEYRCKNCGTITELLAGMGEDKTISCQNCGSLETEKIMSAASFIGQVMERKSGHTCCGREERCETPPCSSEGSRRRA